jgi:uncharacterized membrane protein
VQQLPSLIQLYSFSPGQIPNELMLLMIAKMKTQLHANLKSIYNKTEQTPLISAPRLWAKRMPFLSSIIIFFLKLNRYSNKPQRFKKKWKSSWFSGSFLHGFKEM